MLHSNLFAMTDAQIAAYVVTDIDAAWMVAECPDEFSEVAVSAAWDAIELDGEIACYVAAEVSAEIGLACE